MSIGHTRAARKPKHEHEILRKAHFEKAFAAKPSIGHIAEFGVGAGRSLRWLVDLANGQPVHGFDSFEGLPEPWVMCEENNWVLDTGRFKFDCPNIHGVQYHIGLFADTIPKWKEEYPGMISFMHIDSDLYSSCVTVLDELNRQIAPGTVIVFDEMYETVRYKDWEQGEYKAFNEWKEKYNRKAYELGRTSYGEASFRILQ